MRQIRSFEAAVAAGLCIILPNSTKNIADADIMSLIYHSIGDGKARHGQSGIAVYIADPIHANPNSTGVWAIRGLHAPL